MYRLIQGTPPLVDIVIGAASRHAGIKRLAGIRHLAGINPGAWIPAGMSATWPKTSGELLRWSALNQRGTLCYRGHGAALFRG